MNAETWPVLTSRSALLSIGVSLSFVALMLRGFARSQRRAQALRKQHTLAERKSPDASLSEEFVRPPDWFECHLGSIANGTLLLGVALSITALFLN
jgi:hypothetical protein